MIRDETASEPGRAPWPGGSCRIMGVVNVTPDSFSDGGEVTDVAAAVDRATAMIEAGASVIDIGGESTRPGADVVAEADELDRVVPVVEAVVPMARRAGAEVSVDTRRAGVADAALAAGATIVNDVSASLEHVAAAHGAGWVAMHMRGTPATMQDDPVYGDVVADVRDELADACRRGRAAGVERMWLDPGIGFGKTFTHNWELLAALGDLGDLGAPLAVGVSRKGFLGAVTAVADGADRPAPVQDRVEASVTVALWAAMCGVDLVRVHDVSATADAFAFAGVDRGAK